MISPEHSKREKNEKRQGKENSGKGLQGVRTSYAVKQVRRPIKEILTKV